MFILFPETYVQDVTIDRSILAIGGLFIVILSLFLFAYYIKNGFSIFCSSSANKEHKSDMVLRVFVIISLLLPTFAIMLGALEERYLLVLYLLIYGKVSDCKADYLLIRQNWKQLLIKVVIGLIIAFTALSIESGILAELQGVDGIVPLMFNGK